MNSKILTNFKTWRIPIFRVFLFVTFLSSTSYAQVGRSYTVPASTDDGWSVTNLKESQYDLTKINLLLEKLSADPHQIEGIVIIQNGQLILENYYGEFDLSTPHDLRSVTKSITALLVGVALEKGFIKSLDDPISTYLNKSPKKNLDSRKDKITIRHLLTMSSGWDCNDWDRKSSGQEDKVYNKKDWVQYTLDLPMVLEPGSESAYCSMGVVLLKSILENASGMRIDEFSQKYLFDPLGIHNIRWGHTSKKEVISAGKRLYLTPRDMAKIGQLILDGGVWNSDQLIPEKWIQNATSRQTQITNIAYGFLWWRLPFRQQNKVYESILATGNGGQYILIFPDLNLVIVFTGSAYNSDSDKIPFAMVNDIFLPTFITH